MREVLTEEVVERTRVFGEHGEGRIVSHRSRRFDAVFCHGLENELDLFKGPPQRHLTTFQARGFDFFGGDGFSERERA